MSDAFPPSIDGPDTMVMRGVPGAKVAARSSVNWAFGAGASLVFRSDEGIADIEDGFVAKLLHAGEHLGDIDAREPQLHAGGASPVATIAPALDDVRAVARLVCGAAGIAAALR